MTSRDHLAHRLAHRLAHWCAEPATQTALGPAISCHVRVADSAEVLFAHAADVPRRPASLLKLVTAAAALQTLPATSTRTSEVCAVGQGTLILRGGGDVDLTPTRLVTLARDTVRALAKAATAEESAPTSSPCRVVVDPTLFPPPTPAPGWRADYYPLEVRPVVPLALADYFGVDVNEAVGEYFAAALGSEGVAAEFDGVAIALPLAPATLVAKTESPTIAETVNTMLLGSSNARAEVLFRLIALARGEPATWEGGATAALAALAELGIDTIGVVLADGSGLSPHSRLRADTVTALLRAFATPAEHPELSPIVRDAGLPLAGISGTLSSAHGWFVTREPHSARGRIWAKPGILAHTIALAGLVPAAHSGTHTPLAFCVMADQRPPASSLPAAKKCLAEFANRLCDVV